MTTTTFTIPDGTTLTQARDRGGRVFGVDPVTSRTCTYEGDPTRGRLVDSAGELVREIVPTAPARVKAGTKSTSKSKGHASDAPRWRTLNTFVDVVARHLSPVEIAVWMVLFRDCRGDTVKASQRNLAERSGAGERSVVRAMRRLRDAGLVEVVKASKSKGEASLYRLESMPERCLDAITRRLATGATMAPDHGDHDDREHDGTGATMAPVEETNRCQNVR